MSDLNDCKVGEYLITSKYGEHSLHLITGETKTQWICGNLRFRKDTGKLVGGDAWSFWARKATPEIIERVQILSEISHIKKRIMEVKVNSKNLEICKAFLAQIEQEKGRA